MFPVNCITIPHSTVLPIETSINTLQNSPQLTLLTKYNDMCIVIPPLYRHQCICASEQFVNSERR